MLNGKAYLKSLANLKLLLLTCPNCGSDTYTAGKSTAFCNFCEQYIDSTAPTGAETVFVPVQTAIKDGKWDEAFKQAETLLKGNVDPRQLYLLALFYQDFAIQKYYQKDYMLPGFMESNADNIRRSLDLTSRWKECYFKAIKLVDGDLAKNMQVDSGLIYLKFISEIRLHKMVDASKTLETLHSLDTQGVITAYATLVYDAESDSKNTELDLYKQFSHDEINAFYYLARYLAKRNQLEESEEILEKLNETTKIFLVQDLLQKVKSAKEASKM